MWISYIWDIFTLNQICSKNSYTLQVCQKTFLQKSTWLHTHVTRAQFVTVVMLGPSICTGNLVNIVTAEVWDRRNMPRDHDQMSPGSGDYKNFKYFKWYKNRNKHLRGIMYRLQVKAQHKLWNRSCFNDPKKHTSFKSSKLMKYRRH